MISPDIPWLLAEPAVGVQLLAEREGIWLRGPDLVWGHPPSRTRLIPLTRLGRLLPTLIPQLCELGLATVADDGLRMAYADFTTFETHGIDAFTDVAPWAPFTLELAAHRWLGAADFRYDYRFYLGLRPVSLTRRGCFVRQDMTIYRLDAQTFAMIEAIDAFNALPTDAKSSPEAFLRFATVKGLAEGIGAQLDRYLAEERVLVPSRVGLDLIVEGEGRISFAPKIDGVEPEAMRQAFFALDDVDTIYALDAPGGGRLRVVLDDQQREVLRRMQRVRHLSGAERTAVLRAPQSVFDGVAEAVDMDPAAFGPRVQGVGDFPFVTQPYLRQSGGVFDMPEGLAVPYTGGMFSTGLTCRYADGSSEDVPFTSRQELRTLHQEAREAWHRGTGTVDFRGKSILVDASFIQALDELVTEVLPPPSHIRKNPLPKAVTCLSIEMKTTLSTQKTPVVRPLSPASISRKHSNRMWYSKTINVMGWRGCSAMCTWAVGAVSWLTIWVWARRSRCLRSWPGSSNRELYLLTARTQTQPRGTRSSLSCQSSCCKTKPGLKICGSFSERTATFLNPTWCYTEQNFRTCGVPRRLAKRRRLVTLYWTWSVYDKTVSSSQTMRRLRTTSIPLPA